MIVVSDIVEWQACQEEQHASSTGLVPTMGALHAGHLSLVKASLVENDRTIVSIFVNPTQFDQAADLEDYPRQYDQDLQMLDEAGVDIVFMPDFETLYPDEFHYRITESELSHQLCGQHRPGHFDGVMTVVMKLLNIIRPDRAYFGEKDYQQLLLIRGMCEAFFIPVNIVGCPVIREEDGLAMSSRNQLLNPQQRRKASALNRILSSSDGPEETRELLKQQGFEVDYVEEMHGRRLAAARLGTTRLIDNVPIQ